MKSLKHLLALHSSARATGSHSHDLTDSVLAHLKNQHPGISTRIRDLAAAPIPHVSTEFTEAIFVPPPALSESQKAALRLSDELIAELVQADVVVIGAPMYNLTVPSALKAWIDHIVRPGLTFAFSASESAPYEGLLKNKKAVIVTPRGGVYAQGPRQAEDFNAPYLRNILGFIGITDVAIIRAEGLAFDSAGGLAAAKAEIDSLFI